MQLTFAFFAGLSSTGALALVVPNSTALALAMSNSTALTPAGPNSTALALVMPNSTAVAPAESNSTALALVMLNSTAVAPAVPSSTVMALVMPNSTTLGFPGLNHVQSRNAKAAIDQVRAEALNRQACLAVISTALQESELQIYANPVVPASMNYPHDKVGGDQDSIGMFQQRAEFYSDVATDMSAAGSTRLFLADMKGIAGWQTMEVSALCQAVQKAQAGNLYGQRIPLAEQVCSAAGF
ncbi:peptidase M23B [Beauveria bassiana ARSEF 2860]|uniref:Peptidase M23B n=1 Tax=Beauveria bassiana (strain ARSEF 2860) TaxID=655819 RepID=J4UHT6_BEAB2|nr:peptidase M23B [Beauveria bassiana ARSEF 2860]EJP62867.1 peptidase M23B [Beauveria bassiana ARSEF 2860]